MPDVRIVIIIVVILIILAFILFLVFNTRSNTTNTVVTQTRVANGTVISGFGLACAPGQCVTNIYNGSKICPNLESGVLIADPAFEVCNGKFFCENSLTPYALQSDGSTDNNGLCERGIACRCLKKPQCGSNIVSVFGTSNGTVYQDFTDQRLTITQVLVQSPDNVTDKGTLSPNFQIDNPLVNFCTISNSWLHNVQPGLCNDLPIDVASGVAKCQNRNICIAGTLAFIPNDIEDFSKDRINVTPMGCVYGQPCDMNHLTVWDPRVNNIICIPTV